jgi:hypothetical protein
MKFFSLVSPLVLVAAMVAPTAVKPAATYNDTVNGAQSASAEEDAIAINLTAAGDLPGKVRLTLLRTEGNVTGGTLLVTVSPSNANASSRERGSLTGSVTGGTLTLTSNGTLASASNVQIAINRGTGEFSGVTSGTATINVSASAQNSAPLSGTLVFSF